MRHQLRRIMRALTPRSDGEIYYCDECADWFTIEHFQ